MQEQSIGATLAAARQSSGLTVEQLSQITRIREAIIKAVERDEFAESGNDFYIRGHVKTIARAVGLDPEAVVHRYDQEHGGAPKPVRAAAVFQTDRMLRLAERRGPGWTTALAVALAVVVVFGVVKVLGGASDQVRTARGERPAASVPPNSPFTEAPPAVAMARKNMVVVTVEATRRARVTVRDAKGRELFDGSLKAGRIATWRAQSRIDFEVADAGTVLVQVNGKKMRAVGEPGQRVRRSFVPRKPPAR
ncbi:helix-turn-helix domain-containing protein [Nonomuraea sp. CA-218870]|uniref:helix-turn-helix domain-containing protein n=1 Tax=Nonomuraea sp. CA-218870 TaxID=3239998 RepID=UPI003D89D2A9